MALTEEIQAILNQIQAAYPKGIRTSAEDENSTVYKYDVVRATSISDDFRTPFINATNDLCSLTATLN